MRKIITDFSAKVKNHWLALVVVVIMGFFMSLGLLDVPRGLTGDEASFGLNATLLSRTGRDENGKFMPLFVLVLGGSDWKQPVPQYYQALFFKIFGAGIYNLRLSSLVFTLISALLMYAFVYERTKKRWLGILSEFLLLTAPIVFIQSHLALDNNIPMLFSLIWLICLGRIADGNDKNKKILIVIMAVALGLAFYSYKGMRVVVPAWALLTGVYLLWKYRNLQEAFWFSIFMMPFFLVTPLIQQKYPGAIFGGFPPKFDGVYQFFYPYLSYFDPSFLFVTGDITIYHSTGRHGMLLLASLPLIILGIISFIKNEKGNWIYILALASAPLLMGTVNSFHRASRLMAVVPIFVFIMITGIIYLIKQKGGKILAGLFLVLLLSNFTDFWRVYVNEYAKKTEESFGNLKYYPAFERLSAVVKANNLTPYISDSAADVTGETGRFLEQVYFENYLGEVQVEEEWGHSAIITIREKIDGFDNVGCFGDRTKLCVLIKK